MLKLQQIFIGMAVCRLSSPAALSLSTALGSNGEQQIRICYFLPLSLWFHQFVLIVYVRAVRFVKKSVRYQRLQLLLSC